MKTNIVINLINDICWTYAQAPNNIFSGSVAVMKLLYWHLFLKRMSNSHLGKFHNYLFMYDHSSDGCAQAFILPRYEYSVQTFLKKALTSHSVMIDVGANVGMETLIAVSRGAVVHAFEPTIKEYKTLLRNIILNNLVSKVIPRRIAVSNINGMIAFYTQNAGQALLNSTKKPVSNAATETPVKSVTLDSYLRLNSIPLVDIIKIDVEGAEMQVFEGLKKSLDRGIVKTIIWESNQQASVLERKNMRTFLSKKKYTHHYLNTVTGFLVNWNGQDDCISIHSKYLREVENLLKATRKTIL